MIDALNLCCFQIAVCHENGIDGTSAASCISARSKATQRSVSGQDFGPKGGTYPDIYRSRVSHRAGELLHG